MVILRNCFILLCLFACDTNPKIKNVYPVEKKFDFSHEFKTIDGNSYDLSINNLKSDVTIINFWASWCLPCVKEIPSLNNLQEQFKDSSLEIIAINYGEITIRKRRIISDLFMFQPMKFLEVCQMIQIIYLLNKHLMIREVHILHQKLVLIILCEHMVIRMDCLL